MEFTPFRAYIYSNGSLGLHFVDPTGYWAHKLRITITGDPRINGDYRIGDFGGAPGVHYYSTAGAAPGTVMVSTAKNTFTQAQALAFNSLVNPVTGLPDHGPNGWGWPIQVGLRNVRASGRGNTSQNPIGTHTEVVDGQIVTVMNPDAIPDGAIEPIVPFCEVYPNHYSCNPITNALNDAGVTGGAICFSKPNYPGCQGTGSSANTGAGGNNSDNGNDNNGGVTLPPMIDEDSRLAHMFADNRIRAAILIAALLVAYILWKS